MRSEANCCVEADQSAFRPRRRLAGVPPNHVWWEWIRMHKSHTPHIDCITGGYHSSGGWMQRSDSTGMPINPCMYSSCLSDETCLQVGNSVCAGNSVNRPRGICVCNVSNSVRYVDRRQHRSMIAIPLPALDTLTRAASFSSILKTSSCRESQVSSPILCTLQARANLIHSMTSDSARDATVALYSDL